MLKANILFCGLLLMLLAGCAAKSDGVSKGYEPDQMTAKKSIQLDCKAANHLGCRYKGRIYPWNAWVEKKGYRSKDYQVIDIAQNGNKAVVVVQER